ncbi:MAG: glycosyltransferase family 4 protein, partial [Acidobacteriota bacterium]|nr:glycosyltransferase family 4 protein [Acidobacteriota bacterium]
MITTFYPPYSFGGDAMCIYRLTNALARRGHFVDVFHCVDAYRVLEKNPPTADFPNHPNVKIYKLESRAGFLSPLLTQQTGVPFFKGQIKDALEANNYDVIHFHNMSLIGITALSYGKAVKLYTTHEHWLVCPMHVLWKYDREVCTAKECLKCQIVGKRPPQLWRYSGLLEKSLRHVDCFIAPSRFTMKKHLEDGLDIPMTVIPHFIEMSEESFTASESETKRPFFLFVGRLEKIKGLQNVIPIFKKLPEYDLLIAGDGEYKKALTLLAGNSPNIKFLGRLSQKDLQNLYRRAVSIIVPSICYETFGIIIIEAFSMKTPAIVNNLGALPEVIEDSNGGFIYNTENELVDAIRKLAQNSSLRDELGEKGYTAFLKYWNAEAHFEKYFELIERIKANYEKKNSQKNPLS